MVEVAWRTARFRLGDEAVRRAQLLHLERCLGATAGEAAAELYLTSTREDTKLAVIAILQRTISPHTFPLVLQASEDTSERVRLEAAKVLGEFPAKGAVERLAVMTRKDVSGEVRAAARAAMLQAIQPEEDDQAQLNGETILILDTDQDFVSSLVDEIVSKGGTPVVATDLSVALGILKDGKVPAAVVCELCNIRFDPAPTEMNVKYPGVIVMRELRKQLGNPVPFVAVGQTAFLDISQDLFECSTVFKEKPTTGREVCKLIQTLMSH